MKTVDNPVSVRISRRKLNEVRTKGFKGKAKLSLDLHVPFVFCRYYARSTKLDDYATPHVLQDGVSKHALHLKTGPGPSSMFRIDTTGVVPALYTLTCIVARIHNNQVQQSAVRMGLNGLVHLQIVSDLMKNPPYFPISETYSRRYAGLTN